MLSLFLSHQKNRKNAPQRPENPDARGDLTRGSTPALYFSEPVTALHTGRHCPPRSRAHVHTQRPKAACSPRRPLPERAQTGATLPAQRAVIVYHQQGQEVKGEAVRILLRAPGRMAQPRKCIHHLPQRYASTVPYDGYSVIKHIPQR